MKQNPKTQNIDRKIRKFLTRKYTSLLFVRRYNFSFLFAIYHAYRRLLQKESGCGIYNNVLVYKNPNNFYEFFVNFANFNSCLVEKINSKRKSRILHSGINRYYERIKEFHSIADQGSLNKKSSNERVFYLASKILAFESLTFKIPYIARDLKIPLRDKLLIKKCEKARLETENLFTPGGKMDLCLDKLNFLPRYLKQYKSNIKEFILFNDYIVTDKKIIREFRQIKKKLFEERFVEKEAIKGAIAYKGKVKGNTKIILSPKDFPKMQKGDIIVAHGTTPDYMPVVRICSGIISDEGGFLCHASIVSRELKIPCIVGTKVATRILKDYNLVELDADNGVVKILKRD